MSSNSFVSDDCIPVTPSDTIVYRAGCVKCTGSAGNIVVKTYAGNIRTIPIKADEMVPTMVTQILAASTATGLYLYTVV